MKQIERVLVSTDSFEIAEISKSYGAEVPFMRPGRLATDNSPEWLSWRHALENFKIINGHLPDAMVSLPTTAPLRNVKDVENCLDEFHVSECDAVITVTQAHRNPYFNMVKDNIDGSVSLVFESSGYFRRQDTPVIRDMTTVCYVVKPAFVLSRDSLFQGRVKAVDVPRERAIDIDTLLDFKLAECLLKSREAGEWQHFMN